MHENKTAEIDFDAWSEMARDDPPAFEALRRKAIDEVIDNAPERDRERLRRLQWRIDQERRLAGTPMAACLRISRMMWQSVLGPGGLHERFGELQRLLDGPAGPDNADRKPARGEVVAFGRVAE